MKPFVLLIIAVLLVAAPVAAQDPVPADSADWNFGILTGLGKFQFDGEYSLLEAPLSAGVVRSFNVTDVGAYIAVSAEGGGEGDDAAQVGVVLQAQFFKQFGVGIGYDFWRTDIGVQDPGEDNLFFTVTFGIWEQ